MEEFINKLTIELLSQPLILVLVIIGSLGLIYSIITNVKYYVIHIIAFLFIISLSGMLGKEIQELSLALAIILIIIFVLVFIFLKFANTRSPNVLNKEIINHEFPKANICPKCGGVLKERTGKYGKFYGCSNYPNCKFVRKINEEQNIIVNVNITEGKNIESVSVTNDNKCPKCGAELVLKNGRYGDFYGCSNYPKCKYTKKLVN